MLVAGPVQVNTRHIWSYKRSNNRPKFRAHTALCGESEVCKRNKARQIDSPGLLNPLDITAERWVDISMEFLVSLPKTSDESDPITVIVDRLTKRAMFITN